MLHLVPHRLRWALPCESDEGTELRSAPRSGERLPAALGAAPGEARGAVPGRMSRPGAPSSSAGPAGLPRTPGPVPGKVCRRVRSPGAGRRGGLGRQRRGRGGLGWAHVLDGFKFASPDDMYLWPSLLSSSLPNDFGVHFIFSCNTQIITNVLIFGLSLGKRCHCVALQESCKNL